MNGFEYKDSTRQGICLMKNNLDKHVKNKHLTICERMIIQVRLKDGHSVYSISKEIGCSYNTVKNEIHRGLCPMYKNHRKCYKATFGQKQYEKNRKNSHRIGKFYDCTKFINEIENNFQDSLKKWSIDASVGRLKLEKKYSKEKSVCTKTIYNWIHKDLLNLTKTDMPEILKRKRRKGKLRNNQKTAKKKLGRSIEELPKEVAERNTFGNWEIDSVIGKKTGENPVILTIAERVTDYYITRKISSKQAEKVQIELKKLKQSYGTKADEIFKIIISDNGAEFASLSELENNSKTRIYFAHPYSSYERGINERHNRILRRYVKKGFDIGKITKAELEQYEDLINGLPRKRLGYRTPEEVFNEYLDQIYKIE